MNVSIVEGLTPSCLGCQSPAQPAMSMHACMHAILYSVSKCIQCPVRALGHRTFCAAQLIRHPARKKGNAISCAYASMIGSSDAEGQAPGRSGPQWRKPAQHMRVLASPGAHRQHRLLLPNSSVRASIEADFMTAPKPDVSNTETPAFRDVALE